MWSCSPFIGEYPLFAYKGVKQMGEFDYSRSGNPTRKALEDCLAALEGGTRGFYTAREWRRGVGLALFSAGDHIIVHNDLYGGTYRLLVNVTAKQGIEVEFVNLRNLDALGAAIRPNTKLIWTETPTNPLMNILDLAAIARIAKSKGVLTLCDNTFLTPYLQNPLFGWVSTYVLHSIVEVYINGHSDISEGQSSLMTWSWQRRYTSIRTRWALAKTQFDCFLVLRGVRDFLAVRMEAHGSSLTLARWLEAHPKVERVNHPGLESHPQHELAARQARGFGGTFSFLVNGGEEACDKLLGRVKLTLAESLGGVESLIEHP